MQSRTRTVSQWIVILALLLSLFPATVFAQDQTIVEIAVGNPDFSTLVTAVTEAGLVDVLSGEGPFTVFAPTNAAFAKLPADTLAAVLADKDLLTQILTYHVISGKVMAADVSDGLVAPTVQTGSVTFKVVDGAVMINDANIIATDIEASNGVIHVIDTVLMPPADEAMAAEATPAPVEEAAAPVAEATPAPVEEAAAADIVDIAVGNPDFSTLVTAVTEAGLVDALKGEGPFTVFAPTNAAFAKLPAETLSAVLADKALLTDILTYHVVAGKVMAADVADGLEVETLQTGTVKFTVANGAVMINDANIIATDIVASNGVIHVIDTVIMPPADAAAPAEAAMSDEAPEHMPVTGGEQNVLPAVAAAATLLVAGTLAFVFRKKLA